MSMNQRCKDRADDWQVNFHQNKVPLEQKLWVSRERPSDWSRERPSDWSQKWRSDWSRELRSDWNRERVSRKMKNVWICGLWHIFVLVQRKRWCTNFSLL